MSTHRCPADDDAAIRNVLSLAALLNDEGDPEDQRKVHAPDATWHLAPGTWHLAPGTWATSPGRAPTKWWPPRWGAATMASSAPEPMPAIS
jgi:hypothetical protein